MPGPTANLLADIFVAGAGPGFPNSAFFDTNGFYHPNNFFGLDINGFGLGGSGYGLVTGFETTAAPEASTSALLGLGLIALETVRRYRNRRRQVCEGIR